MTAATATELSFLRAVAARPDDPLPKFIFADHLDELGDPAGRVMRWAGETGRRPYKLRYSRRSTWWATTDLKSIVGSSVSFLPFNLVRRMRGRRVSEKKALRPLTLWLALLRAARRCAAEGVDPLEGV